MVAAISADLPSQFSMALDSLSMSSGAAFTLRFCEDVRFENNVIQTEKPDVRPLVMIHDC